jgi:outer membrane receptor protein involved in Fe transport
MFDGKVHTLAGARLDKIKGDNYSNANTPNPSQSYTEYPSKVSPQFGVLYKPVEGLSFFANYSTSIVNLYTTIARNPDGTFFNPVPGSGKGYDFGVKTDMFMGKLSGVLSFYQLEEQDIIRQLPQVTVGNETFTPSQQTGINSSSGVELDVTYRPTKTTQIGLGYGYTYAYVESDTGAAAVINGVRMLTRENHQLAYSPRHLIGGNIRQDLPGFGPFKSTYLLGNGRWVDKRQHTEAWFAHNGGLVPPWMIDAYALFNVGVGAQFDLGGAKCNASLMVKNVLDERYMASRFFFGAPRTIELTLRANF